MPYVVRSNGRSALKLCSCAKAKENHNFVTNCIGWWDWFTNVRWAYMAREWRMMNIVDEMTLLQFSVSYVNHNNCRTCTAEAVAVNCVVLLFHSHCWSFVRLTRLKKAFWIMTPCRLVLDWVWHPVRWYMLTSFSLKPAISTSFL